MHRGDRRRLTRKAAHKRSHDLPQRGVHPRAVQLNSEAAIFAVILHEIAGFYVLFKAVTLVDLAPGDAVAVIRSDNNCRLWRLLPSWQSEYNTCCRFFGFPTRWRKRSQASGAASGVPLGPLGDVLLVAHLLAATSSPFDVSARKSSSLGCRFG